MKSLQQVLFFVIGFVVGSTLMLFPMRAFKNQKSKENIELHERIRNKIMLHHSENVKVPYDEALSRSLYDKVKILCMVMTHPKNHRKKAIHVRDTWGRRCNKLLFVTSREDLELETIILPLKESRSVLWNKTKSGFQHLYEHYINEYDWFLKADDDNYVIVENLRFMLAQYNPLTAFYFGHRYALKDHVDEGYMAGGGYILSNKALRKFAEKLILDKKRCRINDGSEDLEMGVCLAHHAIFVDCRDELHQKRFFPIGVEPHMKSKIDPNFWYTQRLYFNVTQGNTDCCSETSAAFHYIEPKTMYLFDYFVYKVRPFGLDDHSGESLPQRLPLQAIIAASDAFSFSPEFKKHKNDHHMDPDEFY